MAATLQQIKPVQPRERLQQQTAIAQDWAAERNRPEAEARVAAAAKQAVFDQLLSRRGAMDAAPVH